MSNMEINNSNSPIFQYAASKSVSAKESKLNNDSAAVSSKSSLKDDTFQLTQRLVSATSQFAVQQVVSDAYKSLTQALMIAATGKGKEADAARAMVKKLQKLIKRANRKTKELGEEDLLTANKRKAERQKQERRAEEIKVELKRKRIERKVRERGYLRDCGEDEQDDAVDAQLSAQAMAIAAAEVSADTSGGSAEGGVDAGSPGGAEGGAVSVEGASEGGVDVTV